MNALVLGVLSVSVFGFGLNPDWGCCALFPLAKRCLPSRPHSFHSRCGFFKYQSNYDEADQLQLRALKILGAIEGEEHPTYASALTNRAAMLHTQVRQLWSS